MRVRLLLLLGVLGAAALLTACPFAVTDEYRREPLPQGGAPDASSSAGGGAGAPG
jgi:hypothetical protein